MTPTARKKILLWGSVALVAVALITGLRSCGGADVERGTAGGAGGRADTLTATVAAVVRARVAEAELRLLAGLPT